MSKISCFLEVSQKKNFLLPFGYIAFFEYEVINVVIAAKKYKASMSIFGWFTRWLEEKLF